MPAFRAPALGALSFDAAVAGDVLLHQAVGAQALQLGGQVKNLITDQGVLPEDDVEDRPERRLELRVAGGGNRSAGVGPGKLAGRPAGAGSPLLTHRRQRASPPPDASPPDRSRRGGSAR